MNDFREYQAAFSDHQDDLMHYASKYYDPVKAHAYYMKHRKLKGGNHYTRNIFNNAMDMFKNNSTSGGSNTNNNQSSANGKGGRRKGEGKRHTTPGTITNSHATAPGTITNHHTGPAGQISQPRGTFKNFYDKVLRERREKSYRKKRYRKKDSLK